MMVGIVSSPVMLDLMTMKCDVITQPSGVFIAINDICCRMWQGGRGLAACLCIEPSFTVYSSSVFVFSLSTA